MQPQIYPFGIDILLEEIVFALIRYLPSLSLDSSNALTGNVSIVSIQSLIIIITIVIVITLSSPLCFYFFQSQGCAPGTANPQ